MAGAVEVRLLFLASFGVWSTGCGEATDVGGADSTGTGGAAATAGDRDAAAGTGGTGGTRADTGDLVDASTMDGGGIDGPASSAGAEYLFDGDELRTYDLTIAPADLAFLDADPAAEIYVPGSLTFEGVEYAQVGVRYKGNGGAFNGCVEIRSMGSVRPMGAKTCAKLSIKVSFNWTRPDGRFFGLKKLLFHAMKADESLLRERLAYSTYRDHGVPASRAVHALLRINGTPAGLYALIEEIDGRFTRDRFAAEGGAGNLYKEVWPLSSDPQRYTDALRSNTDEMPSVASMVDLAADISVASDADLPATIERWMDIDHMMRLIAVDRALRADDGPFHWWCNTNGKPWTMQRTVGIYNCGNHNYYWYEETQSPRLWLIPWDMDGALQHNDAASALEFEWDDTNVDCSSVVMGNIGRQWPPSCDRLTRGWGTFQQQYVASAAALLADAFSTQVVDTKLDRWVAQLRPVVEQGMVLDRGNLSVDQWLAEVATLRGYIAAQRADLQARVNR